MSGSDLSVQANNDENPQYQLTPEQRAQARASLIASLGQTPNAVASMPLAVVAPDPKLPGPLGYVPGGGLVESLGGLAHYVGSKGADLINAAVQPGSLAEKWGVHVPQPPDILQKAGERFEENRGDIQTGLEKYSGGILPKPDLTTPEGQAADSVGSAVGAGIGFAPASMLAAVPRGLKTLSSFLLAPREHMMTNIPVNVALGQAQELSDTAFHPENKQVALAANKDTAATATPPAASTVVAAATQPPPTLATPDNDPLGLYGKKQGVTFKSNSLSVRRALVRHSLNKAMLNQVWLVERSVSARWVKHSLI